MNMKTTTILGTIALFIAMTLNFRHTLDDYGVRNNNLHLEVLAQSNSAGGSGNGSNVGGGGGGIPDGGGSTGGGGGSNGSGGEGVACETREVKFETSSIDCDGKNKPAVITSNFFCKSGYSGSCKDGVKTTYYDCKGEIRSTECYDTTYCR